MAIAVETTQTLQSSSTTPTINFSISGSDLVLVVMVTGESNVDTTGVTWNGTALTKRVEQTTNTDESIWTLDDPATGTFDLVVTKAVGVQCAIGVVVFSGASTHAATNTANGNSTSATVTLTTTNTGNGYVVACLAWVEKSAETLTYLGDGTQFYTVGDANTTRHAFAYDDYSSGADVTSDWSETGVSKSWGIATLEITEAVATQNSGFFSIMSA